MMASFDFIMTLNKLIIISYFQEGLKLSVKVKMKQQDQESMNFKKMVQKAVYAKAIPGIRSSIMVWDSNIYCLKGHRSFNPISTNSQVLIQKMTAKKSRPKEFRPKEMKLANRKASIPPSTNVVESSEQNKKTERIRSR